MNRRQLEGLVARLEMGHRGMGTEFSLFGEAAEAIRELMTPKDEDPWPTPGKPETYSERYWTFHRMLVKVMMNNEPLTKEEAIDVWQAKHALMGAVPEGDLIDSLNSRLERELSRGQRCAVCARHRSEDYNCSVEC